MYPFKPLSQLLFFIILSLNCSFSQVRKDLSKLDSETISIRLDADGEDAIIANWYPDVDKNHPNEIEYFSGAWTIYGAPVIWRNFFKFNLTNIPQDAIILSAKLSLFYTDTSAWNDWQHISRSNSNESVLQQVTSSWEENAITWNTQPSSTTENEVILPQSTSGTQDYTNLDVTKMVQQWVKNPEFNYGFLLRLKNEVHYATMIFASGDHPNKDKHPTLNITYALPKKEENKNVSSFKTVTGDENDLDNPLLIYPNPTSRDFTLETQLSDNTFVQLNIVNVLSEILYTGSEIHETGKFRKTIDVSSFVPGTYFVNLKVGGSTRTKKLIIGK